MQFRLKTSKQTEEIFIAIGQREHLQPFALAKLALSLAIHAGFKVDETNKDEDNDGLDLNRQTITGDRDLLFKSLIELNEGKYLDDEVYFPGYVKQYIDYGSKLLEQELRYSRDIYSHLVNLEHSI